MSWETSAHQIFRQLRCPVNSTEGMSSPVGSWRKHAGQVPRDVERVLGSAQLCLLSLLPVEGNEKRGHLDVQEVVVPVSQSSVQLPGRLLSVKGSMGLAMKTREPWTLLRAVFV